MQPKNPAPQFTWKSWMRRFNLLLVPLLLGVSSSAFTHVYKSVDAEGNVVFSDTPGDGAEEIQIPEANVIPAVVAPEYEPPVADTVDLEESQPEIIIIDKKKGNSRKLRRRSFYNSPDG